MSDHYSVLGVEVTATQVEIKSAYRKLALKHHPDKASDADREQLEIRFKEITLAYEVLSDPEKRAAYDARGLVPDFDEFGLYGGRGGYYEDDINDFGPQDFFNFFNGMNGGAAPQPPRSGKTEDAHLDVKLLLEDLFNGKTVKITSTRSIICPKCTGQGCRPGAHTRACSKCSGSGVVEQIKRVGAGYMQRVQVECTQCHGHGTVFRAKDKCRRCDGACLVDETKILEFVVRRGARDGETVVLKGELDQALRKQPGDVVLTVLEQEHPRFKRTGDDLHAEVHVTLVEALSGFLRSLVKHLDGRHLMVTTLPGKVVRPGDVVKIPNEGMPVEGTFRMRRGDMYCHVVVDFPQDNWFLEKGELAKLSTLIPDTLFATQRPQVAEGEPVDEVDYVVVKARDIPEPEEETAHESARPQCPTQ